MPSSIHHSEPSTAKIDGIELVYDTFGDPSHPPLLLIMGLGGQMISWEDDLCAQLAARGYWVIRFDNRDVGLSTKFDRADTPNLFALMQSFVQKDPIHAPYTLRDMAKDAVGLLEALGIQAAHVVGVSMGGMIAQMLAIYHPGHVRTLTSIMSTTGHPDLPLPKSEAIALLTRPTPADREGYIDASLRDMKFLNGDLPLDEQRAREHAAKAYDRGLCPAGFNRQLAAILGSGSRREALHSVKIPTLVIHGRADPLVPVEGGIDTAQSIPGAKLLIIEGMGHSLPPVIWPKIIEAIAEHAV